MRGSSGASFRSGFVAVLGRPNVGKSTLVNRLVGHKVSIVSDHPQTTRRRISGVVGGTDYQLVLLDLPGFQKPFDSLTRRMQAAVDSALREVDAALFLLSGTEPFGGGDRYIAAAVAAAGLPFVAAVNKVDRLAPARRAERVTEAQALFADHAIHAISALHGEGLDELLADLVAAMPEGPMYFPEGHVSDQPLEILVGELIREQALRVTREEVPHAIAVEVGSVTERPGASLVEIEARLVVERDSQKAMLIGEGGRTVKRIGSGARRQIEAALGAQVYLDLRVRVRKRWRRDDAFVERSL